MIFNRRAILVALPKPSFQLPNTGLSGCRTPKEGKTESCARDTYVVRSGLDLRVQPMLVLVPERRIADEEDVQDDAARPYVDRLPVRLLLQHLRAEVTGCSGETCSSISANFIFCPGDGIQACR